jgi:hypothetical protein
MRQNYNGRWNNDVERAREGGLVSGFFAMCAVFAGLFGFLFAVFFVFGEALKLLH